METLGQLLGEWRHFVPLALTLAATAGLLSVAHAFLILRARRTGRSPGFARHLLMLGITLVGGVAVVLALPVGEALRDRLLGLLGLALTAVIAFSSTTFVSNIMAGLMLRAVGNFRTGDFVRVGEHFGRVTERGLFHTEIQTEYRDLATLPNLYLVTQPVTVVSESGTVLQTQLSLGYDVPHAQVEELMSKAALDAGLEDPFVHVLELGDFSVRYQVSGFLGEVKQLLSARSRLRASVLDSLHGAGVEVLSPNYMVQRRLEDGARVLPPAHRAAPPRAESTAEEIVFDKADAAASLEALRAERESALREIDELRKAAGSAGDGEKADIETQVERLRARCEAIEAELQADAMPD